MARDVQLKSRCWFNGSRAAATPLLRSGSTLSLVSEEIEQAQQGNILSPHHV
jgi:hypothetical protein